MAVEAAAQSRRTRICELSGPVSLAELDSSVGATVALAQPGGDVPGPALAALAVGPEGGWEDRELAGRPLVGLASGVLRAETAAISAAFVLCALRDGIIAGSQVSPNSL